MLGFRRDPAQDDGCCEAWTPTDDPEDAALPSDRFVLGDAKRAIEVLGERLPAPKWTKRAWADGSHRLWTSARPVLWDEVIKELVRDAERAAWAVDILNDLVAARGPIAVRGWSIAAVKRWRGMSAATVEAAPLPGDASGRHALLVPASPETLRRRASSRRALASRAARERRAAEEDRARAMAESREVERKNVAIVPAQVAVWELYEAVKSAFGRAVDEKGLPSIRCESLDAEHARLFRLVAGRPMERLPEYVAAMRAIGRLGRDREWLLSTVPYGRREEIRAAYAEWAETRRGGAGRGSKARKRKKEASVA